MAVLNAFSDLHASRTRVTGVVFTTFEFSEGCIGEPA
jgi:hypothetical protein